jgi:hypothetical protein
MVGLSPDLAALSTYLIISQLSSHGTIIQNPHSYTSSQESGKPNSVGYEIIGGLFASFVTSSNRPVGNGNEH